MISDREKEKLRAVEQMLIGAEVNYNDDELNEMAASDEGRAKMSGGTLAIIDGLFAIREKGEWRDKTDPQEIAAELLRISGVGD